MSLLLPREHGTWGILLVPFLTATAIAGVWTAPVGVALLAVLLVFLARLPAEVLLLPGSERRLPQLSPERARRWAWLYGTAALLAGAPLVVVWHREQLLALAAVALTLFALHVREARRGALRGWAAELLGTAALTLSAPVAWVAATGGLAATGVVVWVLNAAFFSAGLVYVKQRIRAVAAARQPTLTPNPAHLVGGFHLALLLFVTALVLLRWASPLVILPFVLATARAGWGARQFGQRFAVRRLGWSEVAHSLLFAVLLVAAFRL